MEELNQVQENIEATETPNEEGELVIQDENENLFEDWEDSEDTPVESTEEPESEEPTEVEENPFELKIKFNREERSLSEEEARTLAQKGMNYDRFYEPIERLARLNGLSVGDYLNRLNDTQIQFEVSKEMDSLREDPKYENVDDEILEEIATNRVYESIGQREQEYQDTQQGIADAEQAKAQRDIEMFMEEYPEFRNKGPDVLDPKVFDYVKKGYTLLEAYNKWSRETTPQAEAKQKVSKQNEENKKRSLGNTTNAGGTDADDFMSGFLEG